MVAPTKYELHYIVCALCEEHIQYSNLNQVTINIQRHIRLKHDKFNSYVPDAVRTLTIVFEGSDPDKDQPASHIDPTNMFFAAIEKLHEAGQLGM